MTFPQQKDQECEHGRNIIPSGHYPDTLTVSLLQSPMENIPSTERTHPLPTSLTRREFVLAMISTATLETHLNMRSSVLAVEKEKKPTKLFEEPDGEIPLGAVHTIGIEEGEATTKKTRDVTIHFTKDGVTLLIDGKEMNIEVIGATIMALKVEKKTKDDKAELHVLGGFDKDGLKGTSVFTEKQLADACAKLLQGKETEITIDAGGIALPGKIVPKKEKKK